MASYIAHSQKRDCVTLMLSKAEADALRDLALYADQAIADDDERNGRSRSLSNWPSIRASSERTLAVPTYSDGELAEIIAAVLAHASELEMNAGYSDARHDGGAGELRAMVEAYRCGMNRRLPAGWEVYAEQMRQKRDPEWEEYQRLKSKFET